MHSFYDRKRYLAKVKDDGEKTVDWLKNMNETKSEEQMHVDERNVKGEITDICSGLHHLLSTQHIPGIYNPPFSDAVPVAFGVPIEQLLRHCPKLDHPQSLRGPLKKLKAKPLKRSLNTNIQGHTELSKNEIPYHSQVGTREALLSTTANIGRQQHIQGPFKDKEEIELNNIRAHGQYRSVQSSSLYNTCEKKARQDYRLSKLTRIAPDDFVSRRVTNAATIPSIHAENQYLDRPMQFRDDVWELPTIKHKPPFFTALRRNKQFADYDLMIPEKESLPTHMNDVENLDSTGHTKLLT